jgi:hypothetical protein
MIGDEMDRDVSGLETGISEASAILLLRGITKGWKSLASKSEVLALTRTSVDRYIRR